MKTILTTGMSRPTAMPIPPRITTIILVTTTMITITINLTTTTTAIITSPAPWS